MVFLAAMAPRAQAASVAPAPVTKPQRVPPQVRARAARPLVPPRVPEPVAEKPPEPPTPVQETPEEAPTPEAAPEEEVSGSEAVTGVVAGLVNSAVTTPGGSGLGVVSGGDAVDLKQVSRAPGVLKQIQPPYPREAKSRRIEGLVLVRIIIGIDGRVEPEHTRVIRSIPELDAAAVSAVSQWRFSPALGRQGRPVRVIVDIPFQFSLK